MNDANKLFKMPFGKYKGETLIYVWSVDPRYLEWIAEEFDDGKTGAAVRAFLNEECSPNQKLVEVEEDATDNRR